MPITPANRITLAKSVKLRIANSEEIASPESIQYLMKTVLFLKRPIKEIPTKTETMNAVKLKAIITSDESLRTFEPAISRRKVNVLRYQTKAFASKNVLTAAFVRFDPDLLANLLSAICTVLKGLYLLIIKHWQLLQWVLDLYYKSTYR
jgi:hypothetical protein